MKLGFIGTGKIASSVILGVCGSKIKFRQIIVSPRNKGYIYFIEVSIKGNSKPFFVSST